MDKYKIALSNLRLLERKYKFETTNQVAPQVWCDILEELVELATPKKVKKYITPYNYIEFVCPNCNKGTHTNFIRPYCGECGQRLLWEEE